MEILPIACTAKCIKAETAVFFSDSKIVNEGENMCSKLKLSAFKGVRKNYSNLFFSAVLFLAGCSMTFPLPDEKNQTILIIPVETRQTLRHFVFTLDITIEDSANHIIVHHQIEPNPKMLFSYNTQLKPGKYKIIEMIRRAKPGF